MAFIIWGKIPKLTRYTFLQDTREVEDEEATIVGTTQSSAYIGQSARMLIDGVSIDGKWRWGLGCAHTNNGAVEWFSLELEVPKKVTRVQIANRVDCCPERGHNIRISIGSQRYYDPNEPLCLPEIPELSHQPGLKDYMCTGDLHEGKFIKISGSGWLNLCEVKVFTLKAEE